MLSLLALLLILLAVLTTMALAIAFLATLFFWYEAASGPHLARLQRLAAERAARRSARPSPSPSLARLLTRLVTASALTQLRVYLSYPLAALPAMNRPPKRVSGDQTLGCQGPPVLFIHGLYHNASAWQAFRRGFLRAGLTELHGFSYLSFGKDFEKLARRALAELERVHEVYGRPVALVGHSLGGLLTRRVLCDPASRGKVLCAVTLGAPHHGSRLAALGLGRLARSLIWQGELSRRLNAECLDPEVPYLSLATPLDNMVLPNASLQPPAGATWITEEILSPSHVAMLYDPHCIERVQGFIRACQQAADPERACN